MRPIIANSVKRLIIDGVRRKLHQAYFGIAAKWAERPGYTFGARERRVEEWLTVNACAINFDVGCE
jgi:hypothetical protein